MARTLADRLIHETNQIRKDLIEETSVLKDKELDWAPTEGMRTYRGQLREIGAMQAESTIFLTEGRVPTWEEAESHVKGETVGELMASLNGIKDLLVDYLEKASDADLQATLPIPQDWVWFFGADQIEREELVRWVARHEYYHTAQITSYNWMRGSNPYKRKSV